MKGQLGGGLAWLEGRLDGDWVFAGKISQADITTAVLLGYLKLRLPEVLAERSYPSLDRHSQRCEATDAFMAARPSPDEVMPGSS